MDDRDREVKHLKELLDVKERALQRALDLQASEYKRRLDELNHAHAKAAEVASKTISRELYDADMRAADARRSELMRVVAEMKTEINNVRGMITSEVARQTGRSEMVSRVAVVMSILIPLLLKFIL